MSILAHPDWPFIASFIRIETYARDGGHAHPRHRIEVETPSSGIDLRRLFAVTMPCVACGRVIHPIRTRAGWARLYFAATCALDHTYACARGTAARDEYTAVALAVLGRPVDDAQASLWDV